MNCGNKKFRDDLIISQQESSGRTYYVVKDPVTNKYFRLKKAEYYIASKLDGNTSIPDLKRIIEEEQRITYPIDKLREFINKLDGLCLTENEVAKSRIESFQRRRGRNTGKLSRLLYLRLKAVNPDKALETLTPAFGFLFGKGFIKILIALSIIALAITIGRWPDYIEQVKSLIDPETIPTFLIVLTLVTGLHEIAHGVACKRFGGKVHEIGFLLIYFMPAFYCNVSDAWLFEDKKKRIWVSFAGSYVQMVIWVFSTILWRFLDPDTWMSDLCCLNMMTCGLSTLINFIPLLKLDGYYILADYLDTPNLRREAFRYITGCLKRFINASGNAVSKISKREKKIYILYGLFAGVYSIGLLLFILIHVAWFIVVELHLIGLITILAILVLCFIGLSGNKAEKKRGIREDKEGGKMRVIKRAKVWIGLAIIILVLIFCVWELKVTGDFCLVPCSRACIRAEVAGIIERIYVEEGEEVSKGDLIAKLDASEFTAEKKKTEAEIGEKRAKLEMIKKGPTKEAIAQLRKLIEKEKIKVEYAEKNLKRVEDLYKKNLIPDVDYEKAQEDLNVGRKQLEHAESDLEALIAANRLEMVEAAESELERLHAERDYLQTQIEKATVVSPISGIILTHHMKDKLKEHLDEGEEICQIGDCKRMLTEIRISEKDVGELKIGQNIKLKAWSLPETAFFGKVSAIAPMAVNSEDKTVLVVTSEVENDALMLRPGMTGKAKIYCGKRRLISLLTRKIIRFIRVEFCL